MREYFMTSGKDSSITKHFAIMQTLVDFYATKTCSWNFTTNTKRWL